MNLSRRIARSVSMMMIVAIAALGVPLNAHGGMVGTGEVIAAERQTPDREALLAAFDREDVRNQLIAFGVDPGEARDRVAALDDKELRQLADGLDTLPAGGNSIIGALVFIFVVLLVTDLLGFTEVFPFVKKTVD